MKEHAKLYIEYDRNRHADGEDRVADLLLSAATGAKTLFTDLYAIGDDVDRATPNVHIDPSTPSAGSLLPRVLKIKPIDAYVCVEVKTANDLKELWKKFIYSSPKMYRVSDCHRLAKDFSLPPYLTEELQSGPIGDFATLLDGGPCVFRDYFDEVGLEVLCRWDFEDNVRELVAKHLRHAPITAIY
jgi:hypothetical protein